MYKLWNQEEIDLLETFLSQGYTYKEIGNELDRTWTSCMNKAQKLGLNSLNFAKKTTTQYKLELPDDIEVLGNYINNSTKILHRHICGFEWMVRPDGIIKGYSCPKCANYSFSMLLPAQIYVVDFPSITNLYKIGISNNYTKRIKNLGIPTEVVYVLEFDTGKEAFETEQQYLKNVRKYLYNTGKLRNGNTETFRYTE